MAPDFQRPTSGDGRSLQNIDGLCQFEESLGENRIEGLWDGEIGPRYFQDDLIRNNKLASGREQDVLDVKKLERGR